MILSMYEIYREKLQRDEDGKTVLPIHLETFRDNVKRMGTQCQVLPAQKSVVWLSTIGLPISHAADICLHLPDCV